MKIAYFNCFAGAAGDMLTAALIDAGADQKKLRQAIASLNINELEDISISTVSRCGVRAVKFNPVLKADFGSAHAHSHHHHHEECEIEHKHKHSHETENEHRHSHSHHHHSHENNEKPSAHHVHRGLNDIKQIIEKSVISENAKSNAIAVFEKVAQAEAYIHQKTPQQVHFHEVGAVDSIVDIVAVCVAIDLLKIDKIYCSPISVGGGTVKCVHGIMPVPAPATVKLLGSTPIQGGPINKELLTPTGAALLTHFACDFGKMPAMNVESIGYGAGTMDPSSIANVTALYIGSNAVSDSDVNSDQICLLETNIDDATGESIGDLAEKLRENNALDVSIAPIYMKNGRPASRLTVMCKPGSENHLERIVFESGLTLGLQKNYINRSILSRETMSVKAEIGEINVKIGRYKDKVVFVKAEYSICKKLADSSGLTPRQVAAMAEQNARVHLFKNS